MEPDFADEVRVDVLLEALGSWRPDVRAGAVERLAALGDEAIPALVDGIERRNPLQQRAVVGALERLGTSAAARALVNLLPKLSLLVRRAVFAALEDWLEGAAVLPLGGEDEREALLAVIAGRRYAAQARRHAARALGKLAMLEPTQDLRRALPHLRGRLVPEEYVYARRAIDAATSAWSDLPLPASAPDHGDDLPLPSEAPDDRR